jgi:hypothetical protein
MQASKAVPYNCQKRWALSRMERYFRRGSGLRSRPRLLTVSCDKQVSSWRHIHSYRYQQCCDKQVSSWRHIHSYQSMCCIDVVIVEIVLEDDVGVHPTGKIAARWQSRSIQVRHGDPCSRRNVHDPPKAIVQCLREERILAEGDSNVINEQRR